MPMIEGVLSPTIPWMGGVISGAEAFVDDGAGNPDTTYAGRKMLLVLKADAEAWDLPEPAIIEGELYATIQGDGVAYFGDFYVDTSIMGSEIHLLAVVEPSGTWTTHYADNFFDFNNHVVAYRTNGAAPPAAPLADGHLSTNSPNYFEWTNPLSTAVPIYNQQVLINTWNASDDWFGHARDWDNPSLAVNSRTTFEWMLKDPGITVLNNTDWGISMWPNERDSGGLRTWVHLRGDYMGVSSSAGDFMWEMSSEDSGWIWFREAPPIAWDILYTQTVMEIEGYQLVYLDGAYQGGQKMEIPTVNVSPVVWCWNSQALNGTTDRMDITHAPYMLIDNFSYDTFAFDDDPPVDPGSNAFAAFLG